VKKNKALLTKMHRIFIILFGFFMAFTTPPATSASNFGYFGFDTDITTNFITSPKSKLGYVRITVELMLKDIDNRAIVEHHSPLLRDAIVEIISKEKEQKIKSLTGREAIRKKCSERVKALLLQETGQEIVHDVLFTKYLYY
jgi:flagellar FliL protein